MRSPLSSSFVLLCLASMGAFWSVPGANATTFSMARVAQGSGAFYFDASPCATFNPTAPQVYMSQSDACSHVDGTATGTVYAQWYAGTIGSLTDEGCPANWDFQTHLTPPFYVDSACSGITSAMPYATIVLGYSDDGGYHVTDIQAYATFLTSPLPTISISNPTEGYTATSNTVIDFTADLAIPPDFISGGAILYIAGSATFTIPYIEYIPPTATSFDFGFESLPDGTYQAQAGILDSDYAIAATSTVIHFTVGNVLPTFDCNSFYDYEANLTAMEIDAGASSTQPTTLYENGTALICAIVKPIAQFSGSFRNQYRGDPFSTGQALASSFNTVLSYIGALQDLFGGGAFGGLLTMLFLLTSAISAFVGGRALVRTVLMR